MKRLGSSLIAFIVLIALPARSSPVDHIPAAESLVDRLAAQDFTQVVARFDPVMKAALPEPKLREVWAGLIGQSGAFQRRTTSRADVQFGYDMVFVTCQFERATLDAKVVFNPDGSVTGLFFVPPHAPPASVPVMPSSITERPWAVGAKTDFPLSATLALPQQGGPFPGLVLVHGSGPQDRDETVFANKPFRDLAWGLAARGVAVLRYDKRNFAHAARCKAASDRFTVKEESIEDAARAVESLAEEPAIAPARVFVLGHSLGGTLVPRIATAAPSAAGFVILGAGSRTMGEAIVEQVEYLSGLDGKTDERETAQLNAVRDQAKRTTDRAALQKAAPSEAILGATPAYWLDLLDFNPPEAARAVQKPLLILHGGRDYQVTAKDYDGWKAALGAAPNVRLKAYPSLNHLFIAGQGPSSPNEYKTPGSVAPEVLDDIAAWIKEPN